MSFDFYAKLKETEELSEYRRLDIMEFIGKYWEENHFGPSIRDIMKGCGFASTSSVAHHLAVLRDLGKIEYRDHVARSVRLAS